MHINAWSGSGGVGILVKNELFQSFDISVVDNGDEGILWLCLTDKLQGKRFYNGVCYLLPKCSTRQIDASVFYDKRLRSIYEYQNKGIICICGDFNSRCGDESDFIEGVDSIPARNVIDFACNEYSDVFIEYLVGANFCMLNGRNCIKTILHVSDHKVVRLLIIVLLVMTNYLCPPILM